jgi:hypothetical protein
MTVRRWHWVSARENIFAVMNMSYISVSFRQTRQRDSLWTACMPAGPQLCGAAISNVRHGTPLFSFLLDVHGPLYSLNKYIGANTFSCMYQCMVASMQPIIRQDVYASLHTLLNLFLVEYNCTTVHGSEAIHSSTATKFQFAADNFVCFENPSKNNILI